MVSSGNSPPNITTDDAIFTVMVGMENVHTFAVFDSDSFTVTVAGGIPQDGTLTDNGDGSFTFTWTPESTPTSEISFMIEDSMGATTLHSPILHMCTCFNGGSCTAEGLLSTDQLIVNLTCLCTEGMISACDCMHVFTACITFLLRLLWRHLQ